MGNVFYKRSSLCHNLSFSRHVLYRYGFLGKKFKDSFGHICGPILSGLVGLKKPRDHGIPYSLTEEFVSVYRMHCLLPDKLVIRDLKSTNSDYSDPPVIEEYLFFSLHSLMPLEMYLQKFIKANFEGDIVSSMETNFLQIIGKTTIMNIIDCHSTNDSKFYDCVVKKIARCNQ